MPPHPPKGRAAAARTRRPRKDRVAEPQSAPGPGVAAPALWSAWTDWAMHLACAPGQQAALLGRAQANALTLAQYAGAAAFGQPAEKPFPPAPDDRRWAYDGWDRLPFALWQQSFLAVQDWWQAAVDDPCRQQGLTARRIGFVMRQLLDTVAPSAIPALNPEILDHTARSGGRNLVAGALHLADDLRHLLWNEHRPVPESHALGRHLATTPGQVVFRNEVMELIQYAPATEQVQAEPVLFVPAWIMKHYILDLSPENSLIGWLVRQGHTVFCLSWRNPEAQQAGWSLEDYRVKGVMQALSVITTILPGRKIHANGYCLGGTLLAIAAAAMARDGDARLASLTLMAAQIDFAETGELLLFLDQPAIALLQTVMAAQGYLDRPQMARAFTAIRAGDLIWSRALRRYFLGEADQPEDLTVWLNDTMRLPARVHGTYLHDIFLENRITAGRLSIAGQPITLDDIAVPIFLLATEEDHIAPWPSVLQTAAFLRSDLTFVLTQGGHTGGILSQPGALGQAYRIGHFPSGPRNSMKADDWLARHDPTPGSWWPAWAAWLARHSSGSGPVPQMGAEAAGLPPLDPAPGRYVRMD